MKKLFEHLFNIGTLIVSYYLIYWTLTLILGTLLRWIGIPFASIWETIWEITLGFAVMLGVCVAQFLIQHGSLRVEYLTYIDNKDWIFKEAASFVFKCSEFWFNTIGFAFFPIFAPALFGYISIPIVGRGLWNSVPQSIINIFTVSIPFCLLSFGAWMFMLYRWNKTRLHK